MRGRLSDSERQNARGAVEKRRREREGEIFYDKFGMIFCVMEH
jgi:hypothetical protein